jgi:hypothetical protein
VKYLHNNNVDIDRI